MYGFAREGRFFLPLREQHLFAKRGMSCLPKENSAPISNGRNRLESLQKRDGDVVKRHLSPNLPWGPRGTCDADLNPELNTCLEPRKKSVSSLNIRVNKLYGPWTIVALT
ncbi:hypothetical protein PoB_003788000 [Plakobranchus ocellatus]|uniref:Uncharacterized protein n=1 Tax=Plakobranchus ocellatus TaxID=259542 RepID=A0AAV4AVR3_9GAST|nr:hypothetical protein PoB_003788000 [Plakobranchus ocellatus]